MAYLAGVRPLTTQESSAEDTHVWAIPAEGRNRATACDVARPTRDGGRLGAR